MPPRRFTAIASASAGTCYLSVSDTGPRSDTADPWEAAIPVPWAEEGLMTDLAARGCFSRGTIGSARVSMPSGCHGGPPRRAAIERVALGLWEPCISSTQAHRHESDRMIVFDNVPHGPGRNDAADTVRRHENRAALNAEVALLHLVEVIAFTETDWLKECTSPMVSRPFSRRPHTHRERSHRASSEG